MDKKLPGVFANKIDKKFCNNNEVYYSASTSSIDSLKEENLDRSAPTKSELNINQKINKIFSSTNYIYKADVTITLKDKTIKKRIVGKNSNHLITFENELIPISDIIDIEYTK